MKLSVVIPCYNEPGTIGPLVDKVYAVALPGWEREVIVVDDGSLPPTKEAIEAAHKKHPELAVITCARNSGKGAALKRGFAAASGEYLAVMDADLEYDPEDLAKLLLPIQDGAAEVALGSRQLSDNNVPGRFLYYWGGRAINIIFNLLFGTRLTDLTVCTKVFPRRLVRELVAQPSDDFVFDAVEFSAVLARLRYVEVPVRYRARDAAHGKKLRGADGLRMLARMLELRLGRLARPFRFLIVGGSAALLNVALLYALTSGLGLWYLASEALAFVIAVSYSFVLQRLWAFRSSSPMSARQIGIFLLVNVVNLGINTALLYAFVEYLGLWYVVGQLLASALIAIESFFVYRVIFR